LTDGKRSSGGLSLGGYNNSIIFGGHPFVQQPGGLLAVVLLRAMRPESRLQPV
jgi:hypothetical protein